MRQVTGGHMDKVIASYGNIVVTLLGSGESRNVVAKADVVHRDWNPCFDYVVMGPQIDGFIGPMFDGKHAFVDTPEGVLKVKVMDRYETQEVYDICSR
jgi:hypothetical protein